MRILIVDREPDNLVALDRTLLSIGHEVLWADDPGDALGVLPAADAVIMVISKSWDATQLRQAMACLAGLPELEPVAPPA